MASDPPAEAKRKMARICSSVLGQIKPAIHKAINELEIAARQISDIQSRDVEVVMALYELNRTLCDHAKLLRNEMATLSASPALKVGVAGTMQ